ncbi:MAG: hypothetical protein SF052_13875 [Bacteroidia bacterium]|nr:hypothetical protein [Bacteroidia bacterium]
MKTELVKTGVIFFFSAILLSCGNSDRKISVSEDFFLLPHFLQPQTNHYQAFRASEKLGEMTITTFGGRDSVTVETLTTIQGMNIRQKVSTTLSSETLMPISHTVSGSIGDIPLDVRLKWQGQRVSGFSSFPRNSQIEGDREINYILPPGTLERASVFALVKTFPLDSCRNFSFYWYNTLENNVKEVSVIVSDSALVSTPAGTFPSYRVEISGDEPALVMYVSKQPLREVVRIEVVGLPWAFDLIEVAGKEPE